MKYTAFTVVLLLTLCMAVGCTSTSDTSTDSDAGQAFVNNQPPKGFLAIFNGEDLRGWGGGETKDPEWFSTLDYDTWDNYNKKMLEQVEKHWRVADGVLISDGKGPHLVSNRYYGDFEMWVDWKLAKNGDSGIYLRHCPQVQLWDPTNKAAHKYGSDKGSGGLWNNSKGTVGKDPSELADNPIGQWNRMFIRMVGPYVTVILNGKKVVDNVVMENYYHRDQPVYAEGPIHLQTHGSETRFRNVFVRRLSYAEADKYLEEIAGDEDAFTPLFNGKDLTGWVGATDAYEVRDGAITCKQDFGGNLLYEKPFANFVARLQFKTPPGGNNGLAIRMPTIDAETYPTKVALELQVLDDNHIMYAKIRDNQHHGSAYGIKGAHQGYLRPAEQWNTQEVTVDGDFVKVVLNGYPILETHLKEDAPDGHPAKADTFTKGYFGFTGHFDQVQFKNIRIKELD